jgi:hypothetical protein
MCEVFAVESVLIPMALPGPDGQNVSLPSREVSRILWIGRVCQVRGPDRLLELAAGCPDSGIDLAGPFSSDAYSQEMKRRAEQVSNVTVHGTVPAL